MTTTTTIRLPDDLFAELARRAPQPEARADLVAAALRSFFSKEPAAAADLELINRYADELNREARDVLDYQVIP
jgi:hypothetical protein